ncbi:MAG: hypothetical protein V1837_05205 [Candidatus Woesearchaeota archaeon]
MEDEQDLKKHIKDYLLNRKDRDLAIYDVYKELPKEFQQKLGFDAYYTFYRRIIEEDFVDKDEAERAMKELLSAAGQEAEKISEEELCTKCKKEKKAFGDPDFCVNCIGILKKEGQAKANDIQQALKNDLEFLKLTSEVKAVAYVMEKYGREKEQNKFVFLAQIAKMAYHSP